LYVSNVFADQSLDMNSYSFACTLVCLRQLSWKQEAKHLAAKSQERISELRQEVRKVRAEKREAELRLHMQQFQVELSSKSGQLFSGNHGDLDKAFQQKLDGILKGA
jgi:hypothetical protein